MNHQRRIGAVVPRWRLLILGDAKLLAGLWWLPKIQVLDGGRSRWQGRERHRGLEATCCESGVAWHWGPCSFPMVCCNKLTTLQGLCSKWNDLSLQGTGVDGDLGFGRLVAWMSFWKSITSLIILLLIAFLIGKHLFGLHPLVFQWQLITSSHLMFLNSVGLANKGKLGCSIIWRCPS